ncbi:glycosyltransferase family 2 protein [Microbacterium sp. Ag1]|uniref:glycosyltransferase family 2 protein n=1 Tax=Microbacterium sp. Ag1 TaxID=1643443 RepID=UPI0006291166|nr:glycosyltransferase family 2 protein [Microbacterium sp. Ag1]KKX98240.1 hypothetical protein AAY78_08080 [Microbacterium sp. Ag1]
MNEEISDVACIVVHHRSPDTVLQTIASLESAGIARNNILVVDNSGDDELVGRLEERGTAAIQTENRGYAAAANVGLEELRRSGRARAFTLIATHEVLPEADAVRELREVMADERVAVAGPTLLHGAPARTWSEGGRLSPVLRIPSHHREEDAGARHGVDRDWLDGAFTLYRTADLEAHRLDEIYFLYFEETDLHTRLRRAGKRVVWVPSAAVHQESSGTPPRLIGRNLFLFHHKLFSNTSGRCAVGVQFARAVAKAVLRRRDSFAAAGQILAGWRDGERLAAGRPTRKPYPNEREAIG